MRPICHYASGISKPARHRLIPCAHRPVLSNPLIDRETTRFNLCNPIYPLSTSTRFCNPLISRVCTVCARSAQALNRTGVHVNKNIFFHWRGWSNPLICRLRIAYSSTASCPPHRANTSVYKKTHCSPCVCPLHTFTKPAWYRVCPANRNIFQQRTFAPSCHTQIAPQSAGRQTHSVYKKTHSIHVVDPALRDQYAGFASVRTREVGQHSHDFPLAHRPFFNRPCHRLPLTTNHLPPPFVFIRPASRDSWFFF
jgi:hypothetical protein